MFSNRGIQQSQAVRRRTSITLPHIHVEAASNCSARHSSSRCKLSLNETAEEPTLKTIVSDLWWVMSTKFRRAARWFRKSGSFYVRILMWLMLVLGVVFAFIASTLAFLFVQNELKPICKVPPGMDWKSQNQRPLVEYYVHGRGNGHYARSIAVINDLVDKGIDVRMYIGTATMYKALNQMHHTQTFSSDIVHEDKKDGMDKKMRGEVTAISVPSLIPGLRLLDVFSLTVQRLLSDCSISMTTGRYPTLVISDGDMPGMLRAKFGSIPSVSLAHGQIFVVAHKPDWVSDDPVLSHAWDIEGKKNRLASWFSDVIIGTNFVDMNISQRNDYGIIARSPVRREILKVGKERQIRKKLIGNSMSSDGDVLKSGSRINRDTLESHLSPWHLSKINELLLGTHVAKALERVQKAINKNEITPFNDPTLKLRRRKIVLAYFRDKNGEKIVDFLLKAGFDVLLFERVGSKSFESVDGKKSGFGSNLQNKDGQEDIQHLSLQEYWKATAKKYDLSLLDDDNFVTDLKSDLSNSLTDTAESTEMLDQEHSTQGDMPLETAVDTLNQLMKSDMFQKPRIIHVTDMSLFVPFLTIADGVVSSAGSQLMSESIFCHISILALHLEDDAEQRLNIEMSKHRFNTLSRKGEHSNIDNMEYFAQENVVHGMSIENFVSVLQKVSLSLRNDDDKYVFPSDAKMNMMFGDNLVEKSTFDILKDYVESVHKSSISFSYYNEIFSQIVRADTVLPEKSALLGETNDESDIIDPFQGMPTASAVIMNILEGMITD